LLSQFSNPRDEQAAAGEGTQGPPLGHYVIIKRALTPSNGHYNYHGQPSEELQMMAHQRNRAFKECLDQLNNSAEMI